MLHCQVAKLMNVCPLWQSNLHVVEFVMMGAWMCDQVFTCKSLVEGESCSRSMHFEHSKLSQLYQWCKKTLNDILHLFECFDSVCIVNNNLNNMIVDHNYTMTICNQ